MTFKALLLLDGKTATGFEVPAGVVEGLGAGKRPAVKVTLNGRYSYRTTIMPYAGKVMLSLSGEHREAAGVAAGQTIEVTLEVDTEPRVVSVPHDLKEALTASGALERFSALSYTNQKAHCTSVEDAKTPETRQKRIAKVVASLLA